MTKSEQALFPPLSEQFVKSGAALLQSGTGPAGKSGAMGTQLPLLAQISPFGHEPWVHLSAPEPFDPSG